MRKKCQNTPIPDLKPPAHALLKSTEEQEDGKNKQTRFIATPLQTKYCLMQGFSLYLWFSHFYTMGSSLSPVKYFCWGSGKLILQFLNIFLQVGKASFQLLHPSLRLQKSSFYHAWKIRQENTWKAFSLFLLDFSGMKLNWIHLPSGVHKKLCAATLQPSKSIWIWKSNKCIYKLSISLSNARMESIHLHLLHGIHN